MRDCRNCSNRHEWFCGEAVHCDRYEIEGCRAAENCPRYDDGSGYKCWKKQMSEIREEVTV